MKLRKFHELLRWDERQIFMSLQGVKMRGTHSDEEWAAILADVQSPPKPPAVRVQLGNTTIAVDPVGGATQLELGVIAYGLGDWRISNARDVIDTRLPFRLRPVLGWDAFTTANSWRRRIYERPLLLGREDQRYAAGWDGFHAALSVDAGRIYSVAELSKIGEEAIAATLSGKEAQDFWMARR